MKEPPYRLNEHKVDALKALQEYLDFWDASEALPSPDNLTFLHPVHFLEPLEQVTTVN